MRKIHFSCMAAAIAALLLGSCQTPGGILTGGQGYPSSTTQQQTSSAGDLLGGLLGGLLSNVIPLSEQTLAGTWTYSSPECRFDSENALAQAGGMVAANTVKGKLAEVYTKIGVKPGSCTFTFNSDKTCSIGFGGRNITGTYTLDAKNHDISIKSSTGLIKINGKVYFDGTNLSLLFDANKLLSIAQTLSAVTGQGSGELAALASLLGQYKGMMVGMQLSK